MLYELIAVVRPGNLAEVKEIVRTTSHLILRSTGTIRTIQNWGISSLPARARKHQASYTTGHYFLMRYDASASTQDSVRRTLGLDPRMIKFASVKLDGKGRGKVGIEGVGGETVNGKGVWEGEQVRRQEVRAMGNRTRDEERAESSVFDALKF